MFPRKYKKISKFKRFLLKLLNVYAIDRESLNLVNPNYKNDNGNKFILNDKSILLSNGYLPLDRKISNLDIFFRYAPNNKLWNSNERWKRIIPNINKEELILTCFKSLIESIKKFHENNKLDITLNLISDVSNEKFDKKLINNLDSNKINVKFISSKIKGNRGTYLECCDLAENSKDLIFFIEDDYLFEINCFEEMVFTYSRLSTLFKNDILLCPSDYPFYYDSSYNTSIYVGKKYRWRIVKETLLTFLMSKKNFDANRDKIRMVGEKENFPFEKPLHGIYKNTPCLAPIGSLSYHINRHIPAVTENWSKIWKNNFNSIIK
tara:strand:- start:447 stop:1409 length:963 start_codon:yes stop_codon:yes gene_type:complete